MKRKPSAVIVDAHDHGFAIHVTWEHLDIKLLAWVVVLLYNTCLFWGLCFIARLNVSLHLVSLNAFEPQIKKDVWSFIDSPSESFTVPQLKRAARMLWMIAYPLCVLIATWVNAVPMFSVFCEIISDSFRLISQSETHLIKCLRRGFEVAPQDGDHIDPSLLCLPLTCFALYLEFSASDDGQGAITGLQHMHVDDYCISYVLCAVFHVGLSYCLGRSREPKELTLEFLNYKGFMISALLVGLKDFLSMGLDPYPGTAYLLTHVCVNAPGAIVLLHLLVRWGQSLAIIGRMRAFMYLVFGACICICAYRIKVEGTFERFIFEGLIMFEGTVPSAMVVIFMLGALISCQHQNSLAPGEIKQGANRPKIGSILRRSFCCLLCVEAILLLFVHILYPRLDGATHDWHLEGKSIGHGLTPSVKNTTEWEWISVSQFGTTVSYKINNDLPKKKLQPCWSEDCSRTGIGDSISGYGICSKSWEGLSVLDFATLSQLTYFGRADEDFLNKSLHIHFGAFDKRVKYTRNKRGEATLFSFEFPTQKLAVFAVRGTDPLSVEDLLQDARIWVETAGFFFLMTFFPVAYLWPDGMVARFIWSSTLFRNLFRSKTEQKQEGQKEDYYQALESYIKEVRASKGEDWRFFMTGHSLGGGLAGIVGGNLGMDAITFSAPGLHLTKKKFGAQDRNLVRHHTNIKPQRDIIPMVDSQFGLIQTTLCKTSHIAGPLVCHSMGHMICNLMKRCGDSKGRYKTCTFNEYSFWDGSSFDAVGKGLGSSLQPLRRLMERSFGKGAGKGNGEEQEKATSGRQGKEELSEL